MGPRHIMETCFEEMAQLAHNLWHLPGLLCDAISRPAIDMAQQRECLRASFDNWIQDAATEAEAGAVCLAMAASRADAPPADYAGRLLGGMRRHPINAGAPI